MRWVISLVSLICLVAVNDCVDHSKFKTCDMHAPCHRYRKWVKTRQEGSGLGLFGVEEKSIKFNQVESTLRFGLYETKSTPLAAGERAPAAHLEGLLAILEGGIIRFQIDEVNPIRPRYRVPGDDLLAESKLNPFSANGNSVEMETGTAGVSVLRAGVVEVRIYSARFFMEVFVSGYRTHVINGHNYLNFERYRKREQQSNGDTEEGDTEEELLKGDTEEELLLPSTPFHDAVSVEPKNAWSSSFGGNEDSIPSGPSAFGIDVFFVGANHLYGLPEHTSPLSLPSYDEPYRFFNLDVFQYELNSPMALYGAVPHVLAIHEGNADGSIPTLSTGFLWTNPSQSYSQLMEVTDLGGDAIGKVRPTWWMSEAGIMDFFIFPGPQGIDVMRQFHYVAHLPSMAPLFAMGKHQCRWNYKDTADVLDVDSKFDQHDLPYDVIWLDIEHTDGKRYFTWDKSLFPEPKKLLDALERKGRKLVNIVDPHVKMDESYSVYTGMKELDMLVKNADNKTNFHGWCWPGNSVYPDFSSDKVRKHWGSLYSLEHYKDTTKNLFIWNDMNEPSVFNGPELTIPGDARHAGGWEHRELHNLYGMYYHRASYEGLLLRDPRQRPFVLSRSFYIGSHRYGYIWTGDNLAAWSHLAVSIPMVLSHALGGISYIGADVGGFFEHVTPELSERWYQLGIWYPFLRQHAHLDSKRREPWLFGQATLNVIKAAVTTRYRLLPMHYTANALYAMRGEPIITPLWFLPECLNDSRTREIDDQLLLAGKFLVKAISAPLAQKSSVQIFFPGVSSTGWFDFWNGDRISGGGYLAVHVTREHSPVYIKAGSLFFTKARKRRSSFQQLYDPFTIEVYPNALGEAKGEIYADDYNSFDYLHGRFVYEKYIWANSTLRAVRSGLPLDDRKWDPSFQLPNPNVERVRIHGLRYVESSCIYTEKTLPQGKPFSCHIRPEAGSHFFLEMKLPHIAIGKGDSWSVDVTFTERQVA